MSKVSLINGHLDGADTCVICGRDIPEGSQVCVICGKTEPRDLVEVVRCKDCKHCEHFYSSCDYDGNTTEEYYCNAFRGAMKPTDFCSCGERRESEVDTE